MKYFTFLFFLMLFTQRALSQSAEDSIELRQNFLIYERFDTTNGFRAEIVGSIGKTAKDHFAFPLDVTFSKGRKYHIIKIINKFRIFCKNKEGAAKTEKILKLFENMLDETEYEIDFAYYEEGGKVKTIYWNIKNEILYFRISLFPTQ